MRIHDQLLEHAKDLVAPGKRVREADCRRAASGAYYALFHLLTHDGAQRLLPGREGAKLRPVLAGAFEHREMNKAAGRFSKGKLPYLVSGNGDGDTSIPKELAQVAESFVELQERRHDADYDLSLAWSRTDAATSVEQAAVAFQQWKSIRKSGAATIFLLALLTDSRLHSRAEQRKARHRRRSKKKKRVAGLTKPVRTR